MIYCRSIWPISLSNTSRNVLTIISSILSPVMLGLNILLIIAINKVNTSKSNTDKFLICMSISDACCGGLVLPLIAIMLQHHEVDCNLEMAVQFISYSFGYTSFFLLISVALDRYLHLIKLNKYNDFMNEFRFRLTVFVIVAASNLFALKSLFVFSFYLQAVLNTLNTCGIAGIFVMYCSVLRSLLVHSKSLAKSTSTVATGVNDSMTAIKLEASQTADRGKATTENREQRRARINKVTPSHIQLQEMDETTIATPKEAQKLSAKKKSPINQRRNSNKRDLTVTRTILALLLSLFFLYMPYNVITLIWTYYKIQLRVPPGELLDILSIASIYFLFCNGLSNVIILVSGNRRVKKYILTLFSKGS